MKTIRVALGGFSFAIAVTGLWALGSVAEVACSSPEKQGGEGAQCEVFSDCSGGLFCVQMVCTSDASALVMIEEAGATPQAEAAAMPESDGSGGGTPDGGGGTGAPPGGDASAGPDVSAMPAEAGMAPVDEAAAPDDDAQAPTDDDL